MGGSGPLALVGYSLGSGIATRVAATKSAAALILICPFDSMTEVACNQVPFFPRILPMDSWNSVEFAPLVKCPVTVMRAQTDDIVPAESTDKLIQAFPTAPAVKTYPADHNSIFASPEFTADLMRALPLNQATDVEEI
jgi:pimeloyl-ACP methyl ester carboxylesterase